MTTLYVMDLHGLPMEHWLQMLPRLPQERQRRFHACRREEDRVRIAGSGWLLQYALEQAGVPAECQHFAQTPQGKPYLPDAPQLHFSLSHSGFWAVCAVSDTAVGVDVELPRCSAAVARRHFHPEEAVFADDPTALCRLWTAKEAFVKALGVGLTIPLSSFVVRLREDSAELEQHHSSLPYRLHEYDLGDCRMCLCTVDGRPEPIVVCP